MYAGGGAGDYRERQLEWLEEADKVADRYDLESLGLSENLKISVVDVF